MDPIFGIVYELCISKYYINIMYTIIIIQKKYIYIMNTITDEQMHVVLVVEA